MDRGGQSSRKRSAGRCPALAENCKVDLSGPFRGAALVIRAKRKIPGGAFMRDAHGKAARRRRCGVMMRAPDEALLPKAGVVFGNYFAGRQLRSNRSPTLPEQLLMDLPGLFRRLLFAKCGQRKG